jgi:hypothetical protein
MNTNYNKQAKIKSIQNTHLDYLNILVFHLNLSVGFGTTDNTYFPFVLFLVVSSQF